MFASLACVAVTHVPRQRSFDDLGCPLAEVTFVVVDLETTGASPASCAITEVGAVKVRGGEVLGTFQTLVNPGGPIPPSITVLTGITQAMVVPAPSIAGVLDPFTGFVGEAVIVGHNVRFDLRFLGAAMDRHGYPRFANTVVDTCALARRLVRDEVPNCRLATLADLFRVGRKPTHRALDDAWATMEVLHALLERAGSLGVLGLDDLVALPRVTGHPQLGKLALTNRLPRRPGVYVFRDAGRRPLYVGKAVDLRRRVRSYFTGDDRRKIGGLLRELHAVDHVECSSELEASVLEVRMIHELTPRYNRRTKHWRAYAYVKLTLDEPWPRLSVVHQPRRGDGCLYVGPVGSIGTARKIAAAIEEVVPLRRCTARLAATVGPAGPIRSGACMPAQLGVATCPCAGGVGRAEYRDMIDGLVGALTGDPSEILGRLAAKLARLAAQERFEEAAELRDRAAALARALDRQRRHDALREAGRLRLELSSGAWAIIDGGVLRAAGRSDANAVAGPDRSRAARAEAILGTDPGRAGEGDGGRDEVLGTDPGRAGEGAGGTDEVLGTDPGRAGQPVPRHLIDEVATIAAWLDARAGALRVVECEGGLAFPCARLATFEPRGG
jgi:DNA polymerase-3 subunit epsilon